MSTVTGRAIRTFKPRRGRVSGRHYDALERLWQVYGVGLPAAATHPAGFFDRAAPVILEIGSGMGEGVAAMAAADPGRNYLAAEIHTPGVANLLALAEDSGLTNLRILQGDAIELLERLEPSSLDAVHAFFPDPWPKSRHHKRRLFQPDHIALLRSRLAPGGAMLCATDWAAYAEDARAALAADPELVNAHDGYAPRLSARPVTKFEQRGIDAGRVVYDLAFRRA